jgi:hypothetical protein
MFERPPGRRALALWTGDPVVSVVLLQFDTVEKRDAGITAAGSAVITVIEDALFSVPEEDSDKAQPSREIGGPGLDDNSAAPGPVVFMVHLVPYSQVGVLFIDLPLGKRSKGHSSGLLLRQVSHFG